VPASSLQVILAESRAGGGASRCEHWLLCNGLGGGDARRLALQQATHKAGKRLVPWAGCAAPLLSEGEGSPSAEGGGEGLAFCFLPLPLRTGLPVHVNGYFELSSNRRDLWHGDDLSEGSGQLRVQWNGALLRDGVAPLYADLLRAAAAQLGPSAAFYALWPLQDGVVEPWATMVAVTFRLLAPMAVLWVEGPGGGRWAPPRDVNFIDERTPPPDSVLEALRADGLNLPAPVVPPAVARCFLAHVKSLPRLSPAIARGHLSKPGPHPCLQPRQVLVPPSVTGEGGQDDGTTTGVDGHLEVRICTLNSSLSCDSCVCVYVEYSHKCMYKRVYD
jgi:sacsin